MNTLTRNILLDALIVKYYHFISTVMLKDGHLEILHKAILKLHAQVIDIVCVLSHFYLLLF